MMENALQANQWQQIPKYEDLFTLQRGLIHFITNYTILLTLTPPNYFIKTIETKVFFQFVIINVLVSFSLIYLHIYVMGLQPL